MRRMYAAAATFLEKQSAVRKGYEAAAEMEMAAAVVEAAVF